MTSGSWDLKTDAVENTITLNIKLEDLSRAFAGLFAVGCQVGTPPSISVSLAISDRYKVLDPREDKDFSFSSPAAEIGFGLYHGQLSKTNDLTLLSFQSFDDHATDGQFSELKELLRRIHVNKNFDIVSGFGNHDSRWISIKEPTRLTETNAKLFETTAALCRKL